MLLDLSDDKRMEFNLQCLQNELETQLPRLEIERVLANAVVREALERLLLNSPNASWSRQLLDTHTRDPRWVAKIFFFFFFLSQFYCGAGLCPKVHITCDSKV